MSLLLSEPDAALLEAARLARELALRLQHAADDLLEAGAAREVFRAQARHHDAMADELDACIRERGLLPRVPDPELSGLHELADHLAGLPAESGLNNLLSRFIAETTTLRERLEEAVTDPADGEPGVRGALETVGAQIAELQRLTR